MAFLTIDVGTTVVKAAVVDGSGEVLGSAAARTRGVSEGADTAEIAATDLTEVPLRVLRQAFLSSGLHAGDIGQDSKHLLLRSLDLQVDALSAKESAGQIVWIVYGHDLPFMNDDDTFADLAHLRQYVGAHD